MSLAATWLSEVARVALANVTYMGTRLVQGVNDLATTHPALAAEWHPTKNGDLTPRDVVAGSAKRFWWLCAKGHEWPALGSDHATGKACPYCSGLRTWPGFNDMGTTHPALAAEWHPTKNADQTPQQVMAVTNKKVWWLCAEGHEWRSVVVSRASGVGCPSCAKYGFDPTKPGILYFLANAEFQARKVGITNVGTKRLANFARSGWQVVSIVETDEGASVALVERAIFGWLRKELQMPAYLGRAEMRQMAGWTETFSMEGPSDAEVIARIEAEFARLSFEAEQS